MGKFDIKKCDIPTVWCGDKDAPPKKRKDGMYYYKTGTRYECMKKGFGAGSATERVSKLPSKSLQHIKYIGEVYEKRLKDTGVKTTKELIKFCRKMSSDEIKAYLKSTLKNSKGRTDRRAYNSVLRYLYQNGIGDLPRCKKISL